MELAAGAGAPAAGLVVALGEFTALAIIGAAGGALMLRAVRIGQGPRGTSSSTRRRPRRR